MHTEQIFYGIFIFLRIGHHALDRASSCRCAQSVVVLSGMTWPSVRDLLFTWNCVISRLTSVSIELFIHQMHRKMPITKLDNLYSKPKSTMDR